MLYKVRYCPILLGVWLLSSTMSRHAAAEGLLNDPLNDPFGPSVSTNGLMFAQAKIVPEAARADVSGPTLDKIGITRGRTGEISLNYGSGFKSNQSTQALAKLKLLLTLKARPDLLAAKGTTGSFVILASHFEPGKYASPYGVIEFQQGFIGPKSWLGSNEFEREDSRLRFLRDFESQIHDLKIEFPLTIVTYQVVKLKDYDTGKNRFSFEAGWPESISDFLSPQLGAVVIAPPLTYPTTWSVDPIAARRAKEIEAANIVNDRGLQTGGLLLRTRYVIRDLRSIESRVIANTAVVSTDIVESGNTDSVLAQLPIPQMAIATRALPAIEGPPFLDPETASLYAAKMKPAALNDRAFLQNGFAMRRIVESRNLYNRTYNFRNELTKWPSEIGSALLYVPDLKPSEVDLSSYHDAVQRRSKDIGNVLRFGKQPALSSGNSIKVEPMKGFGAWDFGASKLPPNYAIAGRAAVKAARPNAIGIAALPAGDALSAFIAMDPSPHWYGIDFDIGRSSDLTNPSNQLILEYEVNFADLIQDGSGGSHILIAIEPVKIAYFVDGVQVASMTLQRPSTATSQGPTLGQKLSKFDISGVQLGMGLDDALAALKPSVVDRNFIREEQSEADRALSSSVRLVLRGINNRTDEVFRIFYDPTTPKKTITAVGRMTRVGDPNVDRFEQDVRRVIDEALVKRYGQPDQEGNNQGEMTYWAAAPMTKALLAKNSRYDQPCSHFGMRNFASSPTGSFSSSTIQQACGEELTRWYYGNRLHMFLTDGTELIALGQRGADSSPRPAPTIPKL